LAVLAGVKSLLTFVRLVAKDYILFLVSVLAHGGSLCLGLTRVQNVQTTQVKRQAHQTPLDWAEALGHILSRCVPDQTGAVRLQTAQQALEQFETWDRYTAGEEKSGDFSALADLAMAAFEAEAFDRARTYANRLLDIGGHDPTAGNSIHHGNLVLGRLALHDGNRAKARTYLLASGRTPGSPQLDSFGPNMTLAKELLEKGDRQTVLDYFRLCSKFWNDPALTQWTVQVRNNEMPEFGSNLLY
jgi:hypothetical protein